MRQVIVEGKSASAVDIDGSYLYKKYKSMTDAGNDVNPLGPPPQPAQGWARVLLSNTDEESLSTLVTSLRSVTAGNNTH